MPKLTDQQFLEFNKRHIRDDDGGFAGVGLDLYRPDDSIEGLAAELFA